MAMAMLAAGCGGGRADDESAVAKAAQAAAHCEAVSDEPVRISGGKFPMGQESVYAEEGPVRETTVDEFLIDPHEVTVAQFSAFVAATKHVTRGDAGRPIRVRRSSGPDPARLVVARICGLRRTGSLINAVRGLVEVHSRCKLEKALRS